MKELFQDLRNISEKENSDGQAASSSYKHLVKNVQHLQSLLPEDLQSQAEDRWAEVYSEFDDEQMQDVHASPVVAHARTLESGFEEAAQKFKNSLPNSIPLDEILKVISSDDFHDITDRIQAEQGDRNELRNLAKIGLYVERLTGYISIIDGIIDGNSGILALLWGPIAFLLQLAEISGNVYDSLIGAFVEVGEILPDFQASASMLEGNNDAREITVLFFKDLLDIYREALEPFSRHNWLHLFDYLWPKHHANISRIVGHIERLARLMGTEICIEHIHQEQEFRKSALQSFKEQQRKMRRQEYHRILTFFNPGRYDKTLYHLDVLRCQETGTWLNNDHIFTQWFERSEGGAQTLWLRGIPGAGKTVLCSAIIRRFTHMQAKTAFVFITYGDNEISALSTIYSLVFQLAEGDEEAMDIVCGSGCEGSSSDLTAAGNLLCTLVKHCITPVYLVIDGLDEISKSERGRLITELLRQAEMCKELRIILSSRPESDLMHLLNNKTAMIQVHDHNMGSIKNYINERCQHIFQTHRIYPDAETEFRQILAPLADRAGGMFLYAKLVMGMVETMHDLSEMREELKILPKSLDAAYHRIIVRSVRHKDGRRAEKAHLLLGWIACSSVSITIEEAQQALAIRPSNPDQVFTPAVKLDVVDILGPIVEVVDNGIRFVHFTAKEYISSPHLGTDLIDTTKATLELAMRCIDYLCQRHHDPDLSSEERSEKVCTGQYGFHAFATKMWFELVRQYFQLTKPEDPPVELIGSIQMLWRVRGRGAESQNESEEKDKDETRGNTNNEAVFESLGAKQPALYQILCRVSWFRDWSFLFTGSVNKESHKDINDPFTISDTSRLIQQAFNDTLCRSPKGWLTSGKPGCHKNCARILDYYGERPFKCGFPQCNFWRYGFWDLRSRDEHKRSHDKPIKCDVPGCEFGFIGFSSERTRNNHLQKFHQSDPPPRSFDTNNIPSDEIQDILLDFVKSNQVEAVKEALGVFQDALQDDIFRDELMKLAASEASEAMLQLLADPADFQEGEPVSQRVTIYLKESIKARNENTLRYFLDKLRPIIRGKEGSFGRDIEDHVTGILPIPTLLLSQWFDGVKIWSDWFRRGLLVSPGPIENVVETKIRHRFDDDNTIRAAASHPTGDEQLIYLWEHSGVLSVIKSIPKWTSQTLRKVAGSGFSIPLAKWLLKNGACVNEELVRDTNASALQRAAKSTSPEAAEMMQFLLQNGADPYASMRGRHGRKQKKICEEDGAKGIQKHTGMTWDEFIKANSCEVIERDC
ncbi:hypothetical protein F5Y10DRAFT_246294 [Nemania abortiva]|nr:hypothetical protein F5Y10DRAFT_246294 [Nemania abortiva]